MVVGCMEVVGQHRWTVRRQLGRVGGVACLAVGKNMSRRGKRKNIYIYIYIYNIKKVNKWAF
jgi:hypothetical protein